jgi:transposase
MSEGGKEAIRCDEAVVSTAEVRELKKRIRELEPCWARKHWRTRFLRKR